MSALWQFKGQCHVNFERCFFRDSRPSGPLPVKYLVTQTLKAANIKIYFARSAEKESLFSKNDKGQLAVKFHSLA